MGLADSPAFIDQFVDLEENLVNMIIIVGNGFEIHSQNIKIAGKIPAAGCSLCLPPTRRSG